MNISQTTLAERVGYKDKTSIAKVEAGKVDLPQSKLIAFAKALNTNPSYFFNEINNESVEPLTEKDIRTSYVFSPNEIEHIEKYRKLDERGKETISSLLEIELKRSKDIMLNRLTQYCKDMSLNAAHERTDIEVTDDMKERDEKFFDED